MKYYNNAITLPINQVIRCCITKWINTMLTSKCNTPNFNNNLSQLYDS